MIGTAKSISHGCNCLRYINGESRNKKHPKRIWHVKDYLLPEGLDAYGIWFRMKSHAAMQKNVIHVEISPAKEHTQDFTIDDWRQLWDDFVKEYDSIEMRDKHGKIYSHRTNLAGSMASVWLHLDSNSGIPHLHGAVCRKDADGMTNNDHHIAKRAQKAAEAVAVKRGWTTAAEIHDRRITDVSDDCISILKAMPEWSWNDYVARLKSKGYKVNERRDNRNILRGYSIGIGNSSYKASELGKGRSLMVSKIEQTWRKLHPDTANILRQGDGRIGAGVVADVQPSGGNVGSGIEAGRISLFTDWHEDTSPHELTHDGRQYRFYIPDGVMGVFNDEFDYRETANHEDLTDLAVAIFVGLTALDTVPAGSGGGGGGNDEGWRDRKDEDEIERARRCAQAAVNRIGKIARTGRRR